MSYTSDTYAMSSSAEPGGHDGMSSAGMGHACNFVNQPMVLLHLLTKDIKDGYKIF